MGRALSPACASCLTRTPSCGGSPAILFRERLAGKGRRSGTMEIMDMTVTKHIVCLANSRKLSERCVAGKEIVAGSAIGWIRPVSSRPGGAISAGERRYEGGGDPQVMDLVDVPLLFAEPDGPQTENWRLDTTRRWRKSGSAGWNDLKGWACSPEPLWHNGDSTYHGFNDVIPKGVSGMLSDSLRLVRVKRLTLAVFFSKGEIWKLQTTSSRGILLRRHRLSNVDY